MSSVDSQFVKYEFCAAAAAPTFVSRNRGVMLVDEFNRVWAPNLAGTHSLTGSLTADQASAVQSQIGQRPSGLLQTIGGIGDSFTFNWNVGVLAGLTYTRSNGVVTVTGATGHQFYPGLPINVHGMVDIANEAVGVPVNTRIDGTSFTYLQAGADGVLAQKYSSGINILQSSQATSLITYMNRLTGGAYRLVANGGCAGGTSDHASSRMATRIVPFAPQRMISMVGYNDLSSGYTAVQSAANVKAAVDQYPAALWDVFSIFPFLATAGNDDSGTTGAKMREVQRSYAVLKAVFAGYPNVRVHNSVALIGASTGFAKAGYINSSDKIHPTPRCYLELAKYLVALDSVAQTPVALPTSSLDVYGNDALSRNLVDVPLNSTQVAISAPCTGFMPTGTSVAIPAFAANPVGSVTANARADGFGNDFILTYTPDVAGLVQVLGSIPVARFTPGQIIEQMVMKVSFAQVSTRDLKSIGIQLVLIADGITYTSACSDSGGAAVTASEFQQEDIVDRIFVLKNVKMPLVTGSGITTARMDFFAQHGGGGGACTLKIAQRQVTLAA
jgi:hypothetical protein